jgi:hypothetical protein
MTVSTLRSAERLEPRLVVRRRARPFFLRPRFVWSFGPALACVVLGLGVLLPTGNLLLPFEPTLTLEGKMGSKADFFDDQEVQRILMANHIKVHVTRTGSRDVAIHDIDEYDFVFPSGQPAADLIIQDRTNAVPNRYTKVYRPFTSPIVLATYREYAETLADNGIAAAQGDQDRAEALYYRLDLNAFLALVAKPGTSWNSIGIQQHGVSNGNGVLAQSPNICSSNSSGTYMGLVAFVQNGNKLPRDLDDAIRLAREIKPLVTAQGLPSADLFRPYITPDGHGTAPIIVVYEHQYLAYQVEQQARFGQLDHSRVLLYPSTNFLTQPEFIALNPDGDRLGQLVTDNAALRERAVELGFRVLAPTSAAESLPLANYLSEHHVPVPSSGNDDTKAFLPELNLFEEMVKITGGCP